MEIRISFSFLAFSLLPLTSMVMAQDPTCYDTWGNKDAEQQPCYPPGTTGLNANSNTHCCKKGDVCLSNGLCLTPGSHYIMTQQGCTDKSWGNGCNQYCDSKRNLIQTQDNNSGIPLIACPNSINNSSSSEGGPKFCCGPDASSCCSNPASWISIPAGTMYQVTSPPNDSSSSSSSLPLKLGLGVGLGLGVPILILLCLLAYFLVLRPRGGRGCCFPGSSLSSSSQRHLNFKSSSHHPGGKHYGKNGGGGGGGGGGAHYRNYSTPSRSGNYYSSSKDRSGGRGGDGGDGGRRDSFGRVDTNVGPPSDDGNWDHLHQGGTGHQAAWPPNGSDNVAAAIAAWALSQNTNNGPPSPKEMDAGRVSRTRAHRRGETPTKFSQAVELPGNFYDFETLGGTVVVGVREMPLGGPGGAAGAGVGVGVGVAGAAGGVGVGEGGGAGAGGEAITELPTPDYETSVAGRMGLPQLYHQGGDGGDVVDEPDPETHTRSTTVQVDSGDMILGDMILGDGTNTIKTVTVGDQVSPLTISSPGPPPVLAEGVNRGERNVRMIDIRTGRRKYGQGQGQQ